MNFIVIFLLLAGAFLLLLSLTLSISQLKAELYQVKKKLDSVATHVGLPGLINDDLKSTLLELISEGNKIKAIKEYRSATGAGLLEAKKFIDDLSE